MNAGLIQGSKSNETQSGRGTTHGRWLRRILRALAALAALPAFVAIYWFVMVTCFRTPKASYWIDDPTFGDTKYFHFKSGKDGWQDRLTNDPPQNVANSYRLAIVELDEFGDFFQSESDPSRPEDYQLSCAKEMLTNAVATDQKPVLLFLFVHGWRNNASPKDETLGAFKLLLGNLAAGNWSRDFSICGVYVGWRGASIKKLGFTVPAEWISFWGRKSVAEKISSTRASASIFGLVDVARRATPSKTNESRIILAGHSLGAGILMNSVSQALAYDFTQATSRGARPGGSAVLESPVNLVLLLNPAVESVYLRQLRESVQPVQREKLFPWVISLTSKTDWVTKYLFPLAQWLEVSDARRASYVEFDWRNYRGGNPTVNPTEEPKPERSFVPQAVYIRETPGNNPYMLDYDLKVRTNSAAEIAKLKQVPEGADVDAYNRKYGSQNYFLLGNDRGEWPLWGFFDHARPRSQIHPLFWVVTVDPKIMHGHALPFSETRRLTNFVDTITAIMSASKVNYPDVTSEAEMRPASEKLDMKQFIRRPVRRK